LPPLRGREAPSRSPFWGQVATTRDGLKRVRVGQVPRFL